MTVSCPHIVSLIYLHIYYSIGSLTALEELDVSENENLHTLPDSIGMMRSLKSISLLGCDLSALPERLVIYLL